MRRCCLCLIVVCFGLPSAVMGSFPVVTGVPGMGAVPKMPWEYVPDLQQYYSELANQAPGFAENLREGIVEGADAASDVVGPISDALEMLKEGVEWADTLEMLEGTSDLLEAAEGYASVLSDVLWAIEYGDLLYQLQDTLLAKDREAFAEAYNALVRATFVKIAGKGGKKLGAKIGLLGLKKGPLVIITVPVGMYVGGKAAEKAAESFYDAVLADQFKQIGREAHDIVHGTESGADPGTGLLDVPLGPASAPPSGRQDSGPVPLQPLR